MARILAACAALAFLVGLGTQAIACAEEPTIEFVEEPYKEGGSITVESIVVNGKKWTNSYVRSRVRGIFYYDVMPDCRVIIVGRKGLHFFVVIDDVEWKSPIYNSSFVIFSKDGSKVLQANVHGTIILNDEHQFHHDGDLVDVRFDESGNWLAKWTKDGKAFLTVNGVRLGDERSP